MVIADFSSYKVYLDKYCNAVLQQQALNKERIILDTARKLLGKDNIVERDLVFLWFLGYGLVERYVPTYPGGVVECTRYEFTQIGNVR